MEKKASRVGASCLKACGLDMLTTRSLEEYEEVAVALALDMDKLWDVRKKLEDSRMTNALFDTKRWVQNFEKGLSAVWRAHEKGKQKADIFVEDERGVNLD